MHRMRATQVWRLAGWWGWFALLVTVAQGGAALGRGRLAPPDLGAPATWAGWAAGRTPAESAFAVLALVVSGLAWYLLAVTSLGALARLWGAGRLVSVLDVLTLPVVRHGLQAAVGVTLVGTTMAGLVGLRAEPARVAITAVAADAAGYDPGGADPGGDDDAPVMHLLPDADADADASDGDATMVAPPDQDPPAEGASQVLSTDWEVQPGDHLWSIAAASLGRAGRMTDPGTGTEASRFDTTAVARYWLRVIEANTERLVDPDNPDLILPGQVMVLPPVTADNGGTLP